MKGFMGGPVNSPNMRNNNPLLRPPESRKSIETLKTEHKPPAEIYQAERVEEGVPPEEFKLECTPNSNLLDSAVFAMSNTTIDESMHYTPSQNVEVSFSKFCNEVEEPYVFGRQRIAKPPTQLTDPSSQPLFERAAVSIEELP